MPYNRGKAKSNRIGVDKGFENNLNTIDNIYRKPHANRRFIYHWVIFIISIRLTYTILAPLIMHELKVILFFPTWLKDLSIKDGGIYDLC